MKKLLVLLALLLSAPALAQGPPTGPPFQFPCTTNIASAWTTSAISTAVAGVAGKGIYICGWHASTLASSSAGNTTFQLTYTTSATGNTCATNAASLALTPSNAVTSTAPSVDHNTVAGLFVPITSNPSPANLCITIGGQNNLQLIMYYGQY